jgi:hypothetical protein
MQAEYHSHYAFGTLCMFHTRDQKYASTHGGEKVANVTKTTCGTIRDSA